MAYGKLTLFLHYRLTIYRPDYHSHAFKVIQEHDQHEDATLFLPQGRCDTIDSIVKCLGNSSKLTF